MFISDLQSKFQSGSGLFWLKDSGDCPIPYSEKVAHPRPFSETHNTRGDRPFNSHRATAGPPRVRHPDLVAEMTRFRRRLVGNAARLNETLTKPAGSRLPPRLIPLPATPDSHRFHRANRWTDAPGPPEPRRSRRRARGPRDTPARAIATGRSERPCLRRRRRLSRCRGEVAEWSKALPC